MNKKDFVAAIAEKLGVTKRQAEETIEQISEVISSALVNGEDVALPGVGKFTTKFRAEREGVNPSTGLPIHIPAHRTVAFRSFKELKKALQ